MVEFGVFFKCLSVPATIDFYNYVDAMTSDKCANAPQPFDDQFNVP